MKFISSNFRYHLIGLGLISYDSCASIFGDALATFLQPQFVLYSR